MFEHLGDYRAVVVSGPHRSGTTITAKMIAHDTGLRFHPEEAFGPDNYPAWRALVDGEGGVIQCPSMCAFLSDLTADDVAVVMVHRALRDVRASQRKVGWTADGIFRERYNAELAHYGGVGALAAAKYSRWELDREDLAHPFGVQYNDLAGHPLWIPDEYRQDFGPRQTELEDGRAIVTECYYRTSDGTFREVVDGKLRVLADIDEVYRLGLRRVIRVDSVEDIPLPEPVVVEDDDEELPY